MAKIKTSPVWKISKNDLQQLLDESNTLTDVCNAIGINLGNGSVKTLFTN